MKLFDSFFMGGYECADHINRSGERIDSLYETAHDRMVMQDYLMLGNTGISTVREGICWSRVEKAPFVYDFTEVANRLLAAERTGIQQIWDLCHFGYPDDLVPTHPKFTLRFASLCEAFARFHHKHSSKVLMVIPINEISFLSWHSGDVRGTVPFMINSGFDIKYHLCKAAIAGIKALKNIDPECRILLSEPLVKIHPCDGAETTEAILQKNENQYQAMDIIAGRMCPELGGEADFLDILGFNYYHNCQWEYEGEPLSWETQSHRRAPLSELLADAYQRYQRPMILSETGHFGEGRAAWLLEIVGECIAAMQSGVDLKVICLYPLINRPDWDDLSHYHNSGLWDIHPDTKERILNRPYFDALLSCRQQIEFGLPQRQAASAGM
jgi:hypothetical protein